MIPIKISECKLGMVILEEDSYGNNVFLVTSDPYTIHNMLSVNVRNVQDYDDETYIGQTPNYPLSLFLLVS